jgi:hypothetical protein
VVMDSGNMTFINRLTNPETKYGVSTMGQSNDTLLDNLLPDADPFKLTYI